MGATVFGPEDKRAPTLVRFKAASAAADAQNAEAEQDAAQQPQSRPSRQPEPQPQPRQRERPSEQPPPRQPQPVPQIATRQEPALIQLSPRDMAAFDIGGLPAPRPGAGKPPASAQMGPPDTGRPADTPRVSGSGPNGEPLYAASWYREPFPSELTGYLSTASGPGWGLIACRTAPSFRVENCVTLDEYPTGSNIARAAAAAAWQFQVRPPRVGGKTMIGEWVRIRIDYQRTRAPR